MKELKKVLVDLDLKRAGLSKILNVSPTYISNFVGKKQKPSKELIEALISLFRNNGISEDRIKKIKLDFIISKKHVAFDDLPEYENKERRLEHFELISELSMVELNPQQILIIKELLKQHESIPTNGKANSI